MKTSIQKKYIRISLLLSFAISLTIHFSLISAILFEEGLGHHGEKITPSMASFDFFSTVFVAFLVFMLNYYFYKPYSLINKLKFSRIIGSIGITFVSVLLLVSILIAIKHVINFQIDSHKHNEILLIKNFFCAVIAILCVIIIRFIFQKQTIELENEKLRSESLQSQFESLKNQVSPHFLFNSLTALKILVEDSPDIAKQYISHLSQVLRYTLQSNRKQLVSLSEELEFTQSYLFLLRMRYDTNLTVQIKIEEQFTDYRLPPLTIQTLVENAVKHNEISKEYPFLIRIETTENGFLLVENAIQEKLTQEDGTGIGLTNLSKLFRLLGDYDIQIFKNENVFKVEVPLLKP
jgi:sensor histidine kinase YesM